MATPEPSRRLLSGWGRTAPTAADVVRVSGTDEVRALLDGAGPRGVVARGLGRSYGDAAQNAGGAVVDTGGLRGIELDAASGTVRAGAGVSFEELLRAVVPEGWFLPVVPGTRHVTVGGAIAADVHGKNHHADGSVAPHVESLDLVAPAFEGIVTPSDEPELFAATCGGMGLTGIVTAATLRLVPVESARVAVDAVRLPSLDAVLAGLAEADRTHRYTVAWLDTTSAGAALGRGVLLAGDHATARELPVGRAARPLAYTPRTVGAAPPRVPGGLLSGPVVRAFNEACFRRAPARPVRRLESLTSFFHPLDAVRGWNRLYGPRGFVQYQAAVPEGEAEVVRVLLERLAAARVPSFLAVLKRLGPGTGAPLSFPVAGWTLALDLPVGPDRLAALLDELDGIVAQAGGRVYLAKDARLRPELLPVMYPGLERLREVRDRVDPARVLRSDLARRLRLV